MTIVIGKNNKEVKKYMDSHNIKAFLWDVNSMKVEDLLKKIGIYTDHIKQSPLFSSGFAENKVGNYFIYAEVVNNEPYSDVLVTTKKYSDSKVYEMISKIMDLECGEIKKFAVSYSKIYSKEKYENERDDAEQDCFDEMITEIEKTINRVPTEVKIEGSTGETTWEYYGAQQGETMMKCSNLTYFSLTEEEAYDLWEKGMVGVYPIK